MATANHGSEKGISAESFDELRFVAQRDLGAASEQWTLALEHDSFDLAAPEDSITLAQALFNQITRSDSSLLDPRSYRGYSDKDTYCKQLRRASVAALEPWYEANLAPHLEAADQSGLAPQASPRPPILERCSACHSGDVAPAIPFANADSLGRSLGEGSYPHGRLIDEILFRLSPEAGSSSMPRGMTLDAAQRRALEDYFLAIAAQGASIRE